MFQICTLPISLKFLKEIFWTASHKLSNGTNPRSVATSVHQKLLTVFTAPTQLGHTIVINTFVTVPRKRDLFRKKMKNELFIPLCRALLMEYFDIKFIGRRSLVH